MSRKFALLIPCVSTIAILLALCISLNRAGDALAAPPAAAPLEPATPSWRITCLDCPPGFLPSGDRYLKLDSLQHASGPRLLPRAMVSSTTPGGLPAAGSMRSCGRPTSSSHRYG